MPSYLWNLVKTLLIKQNRDKIKESYGVRWIEPSILTRWAHSMYSNKKDETWITSNCINTQNKSLPPHMHDS